MLVQKTIKIFEGDGLAFAEEDPQPIRIEVLEKLMHLFLAVADHVSKL